MTNRLRFPLIRRWILCAAVCFFGVIPARAADGGRLGKVTLVEPPGEALGFVILYADRGGWSKADELAAQSLASLGALVVEVDTTAYLNRLDGLDEKCHWSVGDAESLSQRLQRERGQTHYLTPILAGRGEGGTLARVTVAQAPEATIAGAVSLDPALSITSRLQLCSNVTPDVTPGGFRYGPTKDLPGFWTVGFSSAAGEAVRDSLKLFQTNPYAQGTPGTPGAIDVHEMSSSPDESGMLQALMKPHLTPPSVSELPLIELPIDKSSPLMAVVLSGDGGWRDIDKSIAEYFQKQGVPVVGLDSLRYFWRAKPPERVTTDVAAVMETYMAKWHASKVALIGYSFGADALPFIYNRLPPALRRHVTLITLLSVSQTASFEITVTGWIGAKPDSGALPVGPEVERIPAALVQCFYGQDDTDTACPSFSPHGVEVIRTTGGHHFDGDYDALSQQILDGFRRRSK